MRADEYQKYIVDRFTNHNITDYVDAWALVGTPLSTTFRILQSCFGLMGEGGELVDMIKKVIFHNAPMNEEWREKVKLELGDVGFYWADLCHRLGFTVEEVMQANINKLDTRYPNGFNTADSIKRRDVKDAGK